MIGIAMQKRQKKIIYRFFVFGLLVGGGGVAYCSSDASLLHDASFSGECRKHFDKALESIKEGVGDAGPKCFISYSCPYAGDDELMGPEKEKFEQQRILINRLVKDLKKAGIKTRLL